MSLVISRKDEQSVVIRFGEHWIRVTLSNCRRGRGDLLFDGDRAVEIIRSELLDDEGESRAA